jgi:hypothetical protein
MERRAIRGAMELGEVLPSVVSHHEEAERGTPHGGEAPPESEKRHAEVDVVPLAERPERGDAREPHERAAERKGEDYSHGVREKRPSRTPIARITTLRPSAGTHSPVRLAITTRSATRARQ